MGNPVVIIVFVYSHISGLAMVGTPAEIYSYGTLYCVVMVTDMFVPLVNLTVFLPVFYNLQLTTLYQVNCKLMIFIVFRHKKMSRLFSN